MFCLPPPLAPTHQARRNWGAGGLATPPPTFSADQIFFTICGNMRPVADLEGGWEPGPSPFSPEIYHLILVNCKFSEPKYLNFRLFLRGALHPSPEPPPPFL